MLYDAILGRLDKNKEIIISDMAFSVKVVLDEIIKPISIPVSCDNIQVHREYYK